jgi:hypothetical protein
MKKIEKYLSYLLFFSLVGVDICYAQSPIDDAIKLQSFLGNKGKLPVDDNNVDTILKRYLKKDQTIASQFVDKNPFINSYLASTTKSATEGPLSASSIISSIGGLDVTNIADGFAKFIVKRAKEELSLAFFQKFKDRLDSFPDIRTVFPHTYKLLNAIDQQIYDYSNYLNNLREAFRSDLLTLNENLPTIVDNHPDLFKKKGFFELGVALKTGSYISVSLSHDIHPGDILDNYPVSLLVAPSDIPNDSAILGIMKGSIQTLQLFSSSLKEPDTSKHSYWVGIDKIRQLNNKDVLRIYLGLVLQLANKNYNDIPFSGTTTFYKLLNSETAENFVTNYPLYKEFILNVCNKANELDKMIASYQKPASDSAKVELYAKYFTNSVQFIQYCIEVTKLPYIRDIGNVKDLADKSKKFFDIAYETTDLAIAINRKKYADAVNHLVIIYNDVVTQPTQNLGTVTVVKTDMTKKQNREIVDKLLTANATDPNTKTSDVLKGSTPSVKSVKVTDTNAVKSAAVLTDLAKYGSFMANMINAQTSDEVENAIEAAALPTGSSRIKRESSFNISFNAYGGFFYGHEYMKGVKDCVAFNSYGITAPIGVTIGFGQRKLLHPWDGNGHASWSLFISLIDLGVVAAYRLNNDTVAQVPTIQLKNIFSPGAFISVGIPKTPLSFNMGAQVGPNLRNVSAAKNDYSNNTYIRVSMSLLVDIPIFNLYTKQD